MPVVVYIWKFKGLQEGLGHASMSLSDGTHISWWPRGGDERKAFKGNALKAPPVCSMTLADDIQGEDGEQPERLTVPDGTINEKAIKIWWQHFSMKENWSALDQNCSTVVYMALYAGSALKVFSDAEQRQYQSTSIWTPDKVKEFVQHLIKRISQPAESITSKQGSGCFVL